MSSKPGAGQSGSASATRCGLDFFGRDHIAFASDFPFDAEGGGYLVRKTIEALDVLSLDAASEQAIYRSNVFDLMTLRPEAAA